MRLKTEHIDKLKALFPDRANNMLNVDEFAKLSGYLQDITDEAYDAGYFHADCMRKNYIPKDAWETYPDHVRKLGKEAEEYIDYLKQEIARSKSPSYVKSKESNIEIHADSVRIDNLDKDKDA